MQLIDEKLSFFEIRGWDEEYGNQMCRISIGKMRINI